MLICGKGQQVVLLGPLPKRQHFPVLSHSSLLPCHVVCLELILEWERRVNLSSFSFLCMHSFFMVVATDFLKKLQVFNLQTKKGGSGKLLFSLCWLHPHSVEFLIGKMNIGG